MAGRGRGELLRRLQEQRAAASDETSTTCSDEVAASDNRGSSSANESNTNQSSAEIIRPMGRAALIASARARNSDRGVFSGADVDSSRTSSDDAPKKDLSPVRARGRAAFIASMAQQQTHSISGSSVADKKEVKVVEEITSAVETLELDSEPEKQTLHCRGTKGVTVPIAVNYIKLLTDPDKGVFEYLVDFAPPIASKNIRCKLMGKIRDVIGETRTFDGVTLYLPIKLPEVVTKQAIQDINGDTYEIKITFRKQKRLSDCVHLYNVLFDRIMNRLKFVRFNRKQFDPAAPHMIPQHKLEIWPGYVTAVDEHEGGIMLCLDVTFRVLNQRTVYDLLKEANAGGDGNYKRTFEQAVLGASVITRYNNKTYRVDEVLWDMNPMSTFPTSDGKEITFVEYYKKHYDIDIKDLRQPMLMNIDKRRLSTTEVKEIRLLLVPELTYLTGLTDKMRSDFKIMKDVATCTRITPNQRTGSLRTFIKRVAEDETTSKMLRGWGLTLANDILTLQGRQLEDEKIQFGNKVISAGPGADFNRELTNNHVMKAVDLNTWLVICVQRDLKSADKFIDIMKRNSRPMGIQVAQPEIVKLPTDSPTAYVDALRKNLNPKLQIVVLICPTPRDDRYAAIKRICCTELPIPSQVINSKTLANDAKNRSIVQKIMLQMNCKMGGTLWGIKIPFKKVMICGIDTHHDASRAGNSVAAFVASLDDSYTRWYSRAVVQNKSEELLNGLTQCLRFALKEFQKHNHEYPERIIIFRDGVGDGQIQTLKNYEILQLKTALKAEKPGYDPQFTFIVVQKRINTRMMAIKGNELINPQPGTIVDHSVTRKHLFDFYLVPQSVRQGTVTPTHYIVVEDSANFAPDVIQRLAYKLCFMYYNWPGTVRVPACCQYAHKLAFLVGQHIKKNPNDVLNDKLFYL
ncbi:protein argonaute-3 [Culicoides brevitarsis]|uniref:protein argonaute-3 n=1 Tax=Culicoides brevitarsis TaxID=469753 RepID=UPI00307C5C76